MQARLHKAKFINIHSNITDSPQNKQESLRKSIHSYFTSLLKNLCQQKKNKAQQMRKGSINQKKLKQMRNILGNSIKQAEVIGKKCLQKSFKQPKQMPIINHKLIQSKYDHFRYKTQKSSRHLKKQAQFNNNRIITLINDAQFKPVGQARQNKIKNQPSQYHYAFQPISNRIQNSPSYFKQKSQKFTKHYSKKLSHPFNTQRYFKTEIQNNQEIQSYNQIKLYKSCRKIEPQGHTPQPWSTK